MQTILGSLSLVVFLAYPALGGINYHLNPASAFGSFYSQPTYNSFYSQTGPQVFPVADTGLISSPAPYLADDFGFAGGYGAADLYQFQPPIVSKYFSFHSAPEEPTEVRVRHLAIGEPRQTYRVVFIKAPAQNKITRLSASFAPKEEKTVIYVLSKKPETAFINEIVEPAPTEPSKPEVVFVKYKTPEEAIHAQRTIQAQYDSLGGSTQVSDEGVAPLTSVEGSLGHAGHHLLDIQPTTDNLLHVLSTRSPKRTNSIIKRKH